MSHSKDVLKCLLAACMIGIGTKALALAPIQGYAAPAPVLPTIPLTQSRTAHQLTQLPALGTTLDPWWAHEYFAYKESSTGSMLAATSGLDAGPVLNPRLPALPFLIEDGGRGVCLVSRQDAIGQLAWLRRIESPLGDGFTGRVCRSLVESSKSSWVQATTLIYRLGLDGQTLLTVEDQGEQFRGITAANVDPITDDLLLVRRLGTTTRWVLTRLAKDGQITERDIAGDFDRVLYPTLMRTSAGGWQLLVAAPGREMPITLQWSADFGSQTTTNWTKPIANAGNEPTIIDVRPLDLNTSLVLVTDRSPQGQVEGFRLLALSNDGGVAVLTTNTTEGTIHRLYPIPDAQGLKRHVLLTGRLSEGQYTLTVRLLRGTEQVYQRELLVSREHQFSALGTSGEFLLAARDGGQSIVSVLTETGQTLEQHELPADDEPEQLFVGLAHDGGHYRVTYQQVWPDGPSTSVLHKYAASGTRIWTAQVSGLIPYTVDDADRICVSPNVGQHQIVCLRASDGHMLSTYNTNCDPELDTLQLQHGQLSLGACIIDPTSAETDLAKQAVVLAPDQWRAANGDILWSNGTAVRRVSATGSILNTVGTGTFTSPHTKHKTPLRLLADGSYLFARADTENSATGIAIERVSANGQVLWRHFETGATFSSADLSMLFSASEPLRTAGDYLFLNAFLTRPNEPDPRRRSQLATLLLNVTSGAIVKRQLDSWFFAIELGDQYLRIANERIELLDSRGDVISGYHYQFPRYNTDVEFVSSIAAFGVRDTRPPNARVQDGRLKFRGLDYPLPQEVPGIRLDQDAIDGAYAVSPTNPTSRVLDGQGIVLDYLERDRLLFGAWFLYGADADWRESDLRWLTVSGTIPSNARRASLGIYETRGGWFDRGPPVLGQRVGTAEIELDSCNTGVLNYRFEQGEFAGLSDSLVLQKMAPSQAACAAVGQAVTMQPPSTGFGFSSQQSGGYYEPGLDGQGMLLQVRPDVGPNGTLFGTWFTFDPSFDVYDPTRQHWLSIQGSLADAVNGQVHARIVRANGGLALNQAAQERPDDLPVPDVVVGDAVITFEGCSRATVTYRFDTSELAGRFAGLQGKLDLQRPYACP